MDQLAAEKGQGLVWVWVWVGERGRSQVWSRGMTCSTQDLTALWVSQILRVGEFPCPSRPLSILRVPLPPSSFLFVCGQQPALALAGDSGAVSSVHGAGRRGRLRTWRPVAIVFCLPCVLRTG